MEKSIHTDEYAILLRLLREVRETSGYTQVELAKVIGQSQSFVTKVEKGDRRLDLIQLRTLLKVFGVSMTQFVRRWEQEITDAGKSGS